MPSMNGVVDTSVAPVLVRRTGDIKDQMIEEEQERRERMHEAVNQIEDSIDSVPW